MIEAIKISLEDLQLRVDRRETNNSRPLLSEFLGLESILFQVDFILV